MPSWRRCVTLMCDAVPTSRAHVRSLQFWRNKCRSVAKRSQTDTISRRKGAAKSREPRVRRALSRRPPAVSARTGGGHDDGALAGRPAGRRRPAERGVRLRRSHSLLPRERVCAHRRLRRRLLRPRGRAPSLRIAGARVAADDGTHAAGQPAQRARRRGADQGAGGRGEGRHADAPQRAIRRVRGGVFLRRHGRDATPGGGVPVVRGEVGVCVHAGEPHQRGGRAGMRDGGGRESLGGGRRRDGFDILRRILGRIKTPRRRRRRTRLARDSQPRDRPGNRGRRPRGSNPRACTRRTRRGPLDERRTPRLAQPLRVQRRVQPQRREAAADGGARVRERREGRGGIGRSASDDALVDRVRRREGVRAGPARSLRRRRARLRARRLLQNIRLSRGSRRARGEATRSGGADAEVLRRRGRRGGGRVRGLLRQARRSGGVRGRHATVHRNRGDTRGLSVPRAAGGGSPGASRGRGRGRKVGTRGWVFDPKPRNKPSGKPRGCRTRRRARPRGRGALRHVAALPQTSIKRRSRRRRVRLVDDGVERSDRAGRPRRVPARRHRPRTHRGVQRAESARDARRVRRRRTSTNRVGRARQDRVLLQPGSVRLLHESPARSRV